MNATPKIEMRGVAKSFGAKHVLRGVDLRAMPAESVVIIGGSGTGKSVTLKCVIGLMEPEAGEILIDGRDVAHLKGKAREAVFDRFGMLFQGGALFDSLPVWKNVAFRKIHGKNRMSDADARTLAVSKLRRVGLGADTADLFPAELSGGMQKRVGLARAIACDPEIIFFDEPTTGLDPIMADVINDLIREIVTEMGATALTITHDMSSVRKIADRVAMLHDGVVQWFGDAAAIDHSGNAYVDQFIHGRAEGPIEALR